MNSEIKTKYVHPPIDIPQSDYFDVNQSYWDILASLHFSSPAYNVEHFKAGALTLLPIELDEMRTVEEKTLLHLQCHFGLDTLSWARLGANVTGVDFSSKAIELATQLSQNLDIPARFIEANIYDLNRDLSEKFNIVFTSYGVLGWLPDLHGWANMIAQHLKDDGFFYIVEIHPYSEIFGDTSCSPLQVASDYFENEHAMIDHPQYSYTGDPLPIEAQSNIYWNHSLGEIITDLADAGLTIEFVHSFPYSCYQQFSCLEKHEDGYWYFPENMKKVPLLFSIKAHKTN